MAGKFDKIPRSRSSKFANINPGDEVVISGIAGRFPNSNNVREFEENLYNKVDLVTADDRRWEINHPEIPPKAGKINNLEKFDAHFFGVHYKQAHTMDPQCRIVMEQAYEAIMDAGVNPKSIRGTKTGVFVGACYSESEKIWFYEKVNGFGITGCSRAMLANRISYYLDVHGPSMALDTACSSGVYALDQAYRSIRDGHCDAAIVGGTNLCLHPAVTLQFSRLGVLSPEGCCRSFDNNANGYSRSEAIAAVFLQKAKDAKRIYATIVHTKTNSDGFKEHGITYPSNVMQSALFRDFYEECGIPPSIVNYIEAHATATKVGDPEECTAIESVFLKDKRPPLLVGSVKSNMGHAEASSGLCSIAKVVIAMHNNKIPPNLHFTEPRKGVKCLEDGRLKVVTEPTPWDGGYAAINSFGFGGANAHALLKSHIKEKVNNGVPKDDLPRLVAVSGRTEEAVDTVLSDVLSRPLDAEYIALLHGIHVEEIPGYIYRGYTIVGKKSSSKIVKEIEHYPEAKRPLWFVFSGMGSQWPSMGAALMAFPVFREAIRKCDLALKPRGLDIVDIITNPSDQSFKSILHSFVGIAAVQIGLVDLLRSVNIVPDFLIGHSVGELGCAYADGCFTAEQMILAAYFRGKASIETELIYGSMAAIGLGYKKMKDMCPPDIEVACHNGSDSCTISGPAESMKKFVAELQKKEIFAREVPCSNIAYHSRYIAPAGPKLLSYLKEAIPNPKPRSNKWMSTSVPKHQWSMPEAKYASAEYFTNNLLNSVLFEETSRIIPKNAITLEIAPHGLLQSILKASLTRTVENVSLMKRGHEDNVMVFLQALGKLYNLGLQPDLAKLYPEIEFPVSRGTPMISPLIKWNHTDDWCVTLHKLESKINSAERVVDVSTTDEGSEYLTGHVIDGRNLLPATGYILLVWETIGMLHGKTCNDLPIVFEDVRFHRATTISDKYVTLNIIIHKGSGRFEIVEKDTAVVTGRARLMTNPADDMLKTEFLQKTDDPEELTTKDIYKELRLRGYQYSGMFKSIHSMSVDCNQASIWWTNWVAFMDNMLQMYILQKDSRDLFVPTKIEKICIDSKRHLELIKEASVNKTPCPAHIYKDYNIMVAGGIEIRGVKASSITRRRPAGDPVLEEYTFVAHRDQAEMTLENAIRVCANLAFENRPGVRINTIELIDDTDKVTTKDLVSPLIHKVLADIPLVQSKPYLVAAAEKFNESYLTNVTIVNKAHLMDDLKALLAIGHDLLSKKREENVKYLQSFLQESGFLLSRESNAYSDRDAHKWNYDILLEKCVGKERLVLLKKRNDAPLTNKIVRVNNNEFSWLDEVKAVLRDMEKDYDMNFRLILVGEKDYENGLLGFVNCLRKEPGGELVRCVLIQDEKAPEFSLRNPLYQDQLQLDLATNVLREGKVWGSYRHMLLEPVQPKPCKHAIAIQTARGDLNSISWNEGSIDPDTEKDKIVRVVYSSLNFRDIMVSTGKLPAEVISADRLNQNVLIGFEYSGISNAGRRVMGLIPQRAMSNYCHYDEDLLWDIPDHWTLEDAATVPAVYATVVYALFHKTQIKKGDKILIHAGAGGVGQAAINIALHVGCEIFTTVGSDVKRKFLKLHFPMIDDDHIGNSRDISFEQMIMRQTNGRGVDFVLNSLAEEKLLASVRCLASGGKFLEIGKFDMVADNPLGMGIFMKEVSFHSILLDRLFLMGSKEKSELSKHFLPLLRNGAIKPIARTVFDMKNLEVPFRFMAAGKHIGKVILKICDENGPFDKPILAYPWYNCPADKSYIIFGGLGGFGMELADWLILRGARNIVLISRTGIKNGYQRLRTKFWKSYGVKLLIITGKDVTKDKDVESILKSAQQLAPIDAVFNLSVVLKDAVCTNQNVETFKESFRGKAWLTKILDKLTRKMCPKLRHFVVFSSVSCGRGNAGQTNYGMSNSVMERICEKRVQDGFPGMAIQWGAIGDVGLVADMMDEDKQLEIGGTLQQRITSCLAVLGDFMHENKPVVSSMVVAEKRVGDGTTVNIVNTVANIMSVKDLKSVSQQTALPELGMDSMMAIEIKQSLERDFEIYLTPQDIRSLTFGKLMEFDIEQMEKPSARKTKTETDQIAGLFVRLIGNENIYNEKYFEISKNTEMSDDEIFFIAGIEGAGTVFTPLANYLKSPAVCVQVDLQNDCHKSIPQMADLLLSRILERNRTMKTFTLVAYSYGAVYALELVKKLEARGLTGRLILIDGSPSLVKAIITKNRCLSDTEIQNELMSSTLPNVYDLSRETTNEMMADMEQCSTFDDKLNILISYIPNKAMDISSIETHKNFCTMLYKRFLAVAKYDEFSLPILNTPITLLKPKQMIMHYPEEDYGLSKMTKEKVQIHYINGDHATMLKSNQVARVINGEPIEEEKNLKYDAGDEVLAQIIEQFKPGRS